jgi:hypothetical protein
MFGMRPESSLKQRLAPGRNVELPENLEAPPGFELGMEAVQIKQEREAVVR